MKPTRISFLARMPALAAALMLADPSDASQVTWDGGGQDGNWATAENWSGDAVPAPVDTVRFAAVSVKSCTLNVEPTVASLILEAGFTGTFTTAGKTLTATGKVDLRSGGPLLPGPLVLHVPVTGDTLLFHPKPGVFIPVTTQGPGTVMLAGDLKSEDLKVSGGRLNLGSGHSHTACLLTVEGTLDFNSSVLANGGPGGLCGAVYTFTHASAEVLPGSGTLEIKSGNFDLMARDGIILPHLAQTGLSTLKLNSGVTTLSYTQTAGTLRLNGYPFTTVSGGDFTISNGTPVSLENLGGSTITVAGDATVTGASASSWVPLKSSSSWNLDVMGSLTAKFAFLKNSQARLSPGLAWISEDFGNNSNWTFGTAPVVTSQPANWTAWIGETTTFTVLATGTAPLSYQWRKNGADIPGATSASYQTPALTLSDGQAAYSVVVSNPGGSDTSASAVVTVYGSFPDICAGCWYKVPNSNLSRVYQQPAPPGWGGQGSVMNGKSGGAFDTRRNRLIVMGGGSSQYAGNEVYAFEVDSLRWKRIKDGAAVYDNQDELSAYYFNGGAEPDSQQPRSSSTFDQVEYDSTTDNFYLIGQTHAYKYGKSYKNILALNMESLSWSHQGTFTSSFSYGGSLSARDPATGRIWFFGNGGSGYMGFLDPGTGTWTDRRYWNSNSVPSGMTGAILPSTNRFVAVGGGAAKVWDLASVLGAYHLDLPTAGCESLKAANYPGFEWSPVERKLLAWVGGGKVIAMDSTYACTERYPSAANTVTPGGPNPGGTFGRWRYIPRHDVFILVNHTDSSVYFYRPSPVAPAITSHPASDTADEGQTVSFSVAASGAAPLTYRWRKNGVDIPGATGASYQTPPLTKADDQAAFSVVVSDATGSTESLPGVATVFAPFPEICAGCWYKVPNSNLSRVYQTPTPPGSRGQKSIMNGNNGGAFDTRRNRLIVMGGGGYDYAGNEVYAFEVHSLRWKRIKDGAAVYDIQDELSAYYFNGGAEPDSQQPRSSSTFDQVEYDSTTDNFYLIGQTQVYKYGKSFKNILALNMESLSWSHHGTFTSKFDHGGLSARDPATGRIWFFGKGNPGYMGSLDPATQVWADHGDISVSNSVPSGMTGAILPSTNRFVAVGGGAAKYWNLVAEGQTLPQDLPTTGCDSLKAAYFPGFEWSPVERKLLAWVGGGKVIAMDSTYTCTERYPSAANTVTPDGPNPGGTFGRWRYVPGHDVFILVNHTDSSVYFYRPSGGQLPAIAPVITAQPASDTLYEGHAATFQVAATGTAPLSYQWRKDGAEIPGATGAAYTTPSLSSADDGSQYSVIVANAAGADSSDGASVKILPLLDWLPIRPLATGYGGGQFHVGSYSNLARDGSDIIVSGKFYDGGFYRSSNYSNHFARLRITAAETTLTMIRKHWWHNLTPNNGQTIADSSLNLTDPTPPDRSFHFTVAGRYLYVSAGQGKSRPSRTFQPVGVDVATDIITLDGEGAPVTPYGNLDEVKLASSGSLPGGLSAGQVYHVIRVSDSAIKLAATLADARTGLAVDLTSQGTGVDSLLREPISPSDLWKMNLDTAAEDYARWTQVHTPAATAYYLGQNTLGYTSVWDPYRDKIVVSNLTSTPYGSMRTWTLDVPSETWTEGTQSTSPGNAPYPFSGQQLTFNTRDSTAWLFGGGSLGGGDELWQYRPGTGLWTRLPDVSPRPASRIFHCVAYVRGATAAGDVLFVSGGRAHETGPNRRDTWIYRIQANTWDSLPTPTLPDGKHCGCQWDPQNARIVLQADTTWWIYPIGSAQAQSPVVRITSPADGHLTNQSSIPVAWSVDGVAQAAQTTENLQEGSNTITRSFTDAAGNTGSASITVIRDTQAPVVAITSPSGGFLTNQTSVEVAWTVEGDAQSTQTSASLTQEGANVITRSYTDAAGNTGSASVTVTRDTEAPVVAITSPADGHLTNQTTVVIAWTVDGEPQSSQTTESLPLEGVNTVTRSYTDAAGNTGSAAISITRDTQAPVVAITGPPDGTLTNQTTMPISWTVYGEAQTGQTSETLAQEGANTITRSMTDAAGNTGSASITVIRDTQAPLVVLLTPLDGSLTNQPQQTITWTIDGIQYTADTVLAEGLNSIVRSGVDAAGNLGADTARITLDTQAPSVVITAPENGDTLTQALAHIAWTVDGSSFAQDSTFPPGWHTVRKSATDAAGNTGRDSSRFFVRENLCPVILPSGGQAVMNNQVRHLGIRATDGDGDSLVFTSGTLPAFAAFADNLDNSSTLTFAPGATDTGTYPISVTTSDGTCTAADSFTVTVIPEILDAHQSSLSVLNLSATFRIDSGTVFGLPSSLLNEAVPLPDSGNAFGSPLALLNEVAPAPDSGNAFGLPVAVLNQTTPVRDTGMAFGLPTALLNIALPIPDTDTIFGSPVSLLNTSLPVADGGEAFGDPVAVLNQSLPIGGPGYAFGQPLAVLNPALPDPRFAFGLLSVRNLWKFPDLVVSVGNISGLQFDASSRTLAGPLNIVYANQGKADIEIPFQTALFFDENQDGKYSPGFDSLLAMIPFASGLAAGQSLALPESVIVPSAYFYKRLGIFVDAEDSVDEWKDGNNTVFTARLPDPVPPVVEITSPPADFMTESATIPVTWTVDGVEQDTLLVANLVPGDNRIIRTARDSAGNFGADTVYGTSGHCITYSDTSVTFNRSRTYRCLVVENASFSIFGALKADSVLIDAGTVNLRDTLHARTILVRNGGVITHHASQRNGDTRTVYRGNISASRIAIADSSGIDATGKGLPAGTYLDMVQASQVIYVGASHGGQGSGAGHSVYGDFRNPVQPGAGGGGYSWGGAGGGVIEIRADSIELEGKIRADAQRDTNLSGGAGGSILIKAGKIAGQGSITARGGRGNGVGGGGRIAIYSEGLAENLVDSISVHGYALGTIYLERRPSEGELRILDYRPQDPGAPGLTFGLSDSLLGLTVGNSGKVFLAENSRLRRVDIFPNGSLTVSNSLRADTVRIDSAGLMTHVPAMHPYVERLILSSETVSIRVGGRIDVTGKGYPRATWHGFDHTAGTTYLNGGSHGGRGGGSSKPVYGDSMKPVFPGAGGGAQSAGGSGGGVIRIAAGKVHLDGSLLADGSTHYAYGVGAGGSIWISADSITGTGILSASSPVDSSTAPFPARRGGGGRIALHACFVADSIRSQAVVAGYENGSLHIGCDETLPPVVTLLHPFEGMLTRFSPVPVKWFADLVPQDTDTLEHLAEGTNIVRRRFTNGHGLIGSDSVRVRFDSTRPAIEILYPADSLIVHNRSLRIRARLADAVAGVATVIFNKRSMPFTTDTISLDTILPGGMNRIVVEAIDRAGNRDSTVFHVRYNGRPHAEDDLHVVTAGDSLMLAAPGLLRNDNDPDLGDVLRTRIVSGPSHGRLEVSPDESVKYVPDPGFQGKDSLIYAAGDGNLESHPAMARFNVVESMAGRTYSNTFDFLEGRHVSVGGKSPDQLEMNDSMKAFPYVWMARKHTPIVAKIDAVTGKILAEYRFSPYHRGNGLTNVRIEEKSQIGVDRSGNIWITKDELNRVFKIGLVENDQCIDRNGDGRITTSTRRGEILGWNGGTATDTGDIARFAQDECILAAIRLKPERLSQVSIDANDDVWVGSKDLMGFNLIGGEDFQVKRSERTVGFGSHAGVLDYNQVMTAGSPLLRWDVSKPLTGPKGVNWTGDPNEIGTAAPCLDKFGNVWVPEFWNPWSAGNLSKYTPSGVNNGKFGSNGTVKGCAADGDGDVWVSELGDGWGNGGAVNRIKNNGTLIGGVNLVNGSSQYDQWTGISVDHQGKVWVGSGNRTFVRINPDAGPLGRDGATRLGKVDFTLQLDDQPGTEGDLTGHTLRGIPKKGAWEVVFDSRDSLSTWGKIGWTSRECDGEALAVMVASSNDSMAFRDFVAVGNGETFDRPPGRYLKARINFSRPAGGGSPVVFDLSLGTTAYSLPIASNGAPTVELGADTLRIGQGETPLSARVCDDGLPAARKVAYRWSKVSGPGTVSFGPDSTRETTLAFSSRGLYRIALTASDSDRQSADSAWVLVEPNNPPVFTSVPPLAAKEGTPYAYPVAAYDPDGNPYGFELALAPEGMDFDASGMLTWMPDSTSTGRDSVVVIVRDSLGAFATQAYAIIVERSRAPTVDIRPLAMDVSGLTVDGQAMTMQGAVSVSVLAAGHDSTLGPYSLVLFQDNDFNGAFSPSRDEVLGSAAITHLDPGLDTATATIALSQSLNSGAALIYAFADRDSAIAESDEGNNIINQRTACSFTPPVRSFNPVLEWRFDSSATAPDKMHPYSAPVVARIHDDNGDGRIDESDVPAIIFVASSTEHPNNRAMNAVLRAVKGDGSGEIFTSNQVDLHNSAGLAVGDIDRDGLPEIIAVSEDNGRDSMRIVAFEHTGELKWQSRPFFYWSGHGIWSISIADLEGDGPVEVIVGGNILNADGTLKVHLEGANSFLPMATVADLDMDGRQEIIVGRTAYFCDGGIYWTNYTLGVNWFRNYVARSSAVGQMDDDPYPEVVISLAGGWTSGAGIAVLEHDGVLKKIRLTGSMYTGTGAPLIADFDGDGKNEVGIADRDKYAVVDINRSNAIISSSESDIRWSRPIKDNSSGYTGSTAFDFDNDGRSEILFADEERLWIADGGSGTILFEDSVGSGTASEYPVVADMDNDGNAEIVVIANHYRPNALDTASHKGIRVYGDANDTWVDARSIWNQYNYRVTNVELDGTIPMREAPAWLNGCGDRRNISTSPTGCDDIKVSFLRVDGAQCQDSIRVTARISNAGSHRTGKGMPVSFYLDGPPGGGDYLGTALTGKVLPVGGYEDVTLRLDRPLSGNHAVHVVADRDSAGNGKVLESDEDNNSASATFDFCNKPPTISSTAPTTGQEGAEYAYAIQSADADGDPLSFQLPVGPEGMTIDASSGQVAWIPSQGQDGTHPVEIRVSDGRGGSASQNYSIMVGDNLNNFPRITTAPILEGEEGYLYQYRVGATDPNGDPIAFALTIAPDAMVIDSVSGQVSWPVPLGQAGAHTIRIRVSDGKGGTDEQTYLVLIRKGNNNRPVIGSEPGQTARSGSAYLYQVLASDPDGDPLSYYLTQYPLGMTIDQGTGSVTWTPMDDQVGLQTVKVGVWDSRGLGIIQTWSIQVRPANSPPVLPAMPDTSIRAGGTFTLNFGYHDLDGDAVALTLPVAPSFATLTDSGNGLASIRFATAAADTGRFEVTLRAADGFGTSEERFTFWVLPLGNPPQITTTPPRTGKTGTLYVYDVDAVDTEQNPIRFAVQHPPAGMAIDAATGRIDWTPGPTQHGLIPVTVCAFDAWIGSCQQYTIDVKEDVNHNPEITSIPDSVVSIGQSYRYRIAAHDVDGDALEFALVQGPAGMTLSAGGEINWPDDPSRPTAPEVAIRVSDPHGGSTTQSWTLNVVPDNLPPVVAIRLSANPVAPDGFVTVSVEASDNVGVTSRTLTLDGVPVTLSGDQYIHMADTVGSVVLKATARDALGNEGSAVEVLHVSSRPDTVAPVVTLAYTPANPFVGDLITFTVGVTDAGGIDQERVWLLVDGRYLPIVNGQAELLAVKGGAYTALATAYDQQGNYGEAGVPLQIYVNGADNTFPLADITSPADDSETLGPIEIRGVATDANLAYYTLSYKVDGSPDFVEFHRGTANVDSGLLGTFDATGLENGVYTVRLKSFDAHDNKAWDDIRVTVAGNRKVGEFTLSFTDMRQVQNGLDLELIRSYDSRIKSKGDFGIGWRLEARSLQVHEANPAGDGWRVYDAGGRTFCDGTDCVYFPDFRTEERRKHTITVEIPGGRPQKFNASVRFNGPFDHSFGTLTFKPAEGTYSRLEILDDAKFFRVNDRLFGMDMSGILDPNRYKLTLLDGTYYVFDQAAGGLVEYCDPNGNRISIGPGGMVHSDGTGLRFTRDAQERITAIIGAGGRTTRYSYDGHGNLKESTDPSGNNTRFIYGPGGYLKEIINPNGIRGLRTEYDAYGRKVRQINADGDVMDFGHDAAANREYVVDFEGVERWFEFDARGNLLAKSDGEGRVWNYTYDSSGNQLSEQHPDGTSNSATYDSLGNKVSRTDESGHTSHWTFDSAGRLASRTNALGHRTEFVYDSRGNLLREIGPDGTVLSAKRYDAMGNVVADTGALGATRTYAYQGGRLVSTRDPRGGVTMWTQDGAGNILTMTDPNGNLRRYAYNSKGEKVSEIDPMGGVRTFAYSQTGQMISETDARSLTTRYELDAFGARTKVVHPDGSEVRMEYNRNGLLAASVDESGRITRMEYDLEGRLARTIFPDGSSTRNEYDARGRRTAIIDALGNRTSFTYDAVGNLLSRRNPLGHETRWEYDAAGRKIAEINPGNRRTEFAFDSYGREVRTTHPDGARDSTAFDDAGRKIAEVAADGATTRFEYDVSGNLVRVLDASGSSTRYDYDANGNRISHRDALDRLSRIRHDAMDRVVERLYPDGSSVRVGYDANGNPAYKVEADGDSISLEYDSRNREILRRHSLSGRQVVTEFAPDGKTLRITDHRGITAFAYDSLGRQSRVTLPDGTYISSGYDAAGNRILQATPWKSLRYHYDALNRMTGVEDENGEIVAYTYDPSGNRDSVQRRNGTSVGFRHDSRNRVTKISNHAGVALQSSFEYTYDVRGRRTGVTEADGSHVAYSYDPMGRLVGEERTGPGAFVAGYGYDPVGNRITVTRNGVTRASEYDLRDMLHRETGPQGEFTFGYDAAGRLTRMDGPAGRTEYAWTDGRLTRLTGPGLDVGYEYDYRGRKVAETGPSGRTAYLIDDMLPFGQVVAEMDGSGNPVSYHAIGLERLYAKSNGATRYYGFDAFGSTRQLTDEAGNLTDTWTYDAFGVEVGRTGNSPNRFLFAGEQFDGASGRYDLRARWYDPNRGRFLGEDAYQGRIGDPTSFHRFLYCGNDPVNRMDPSGNLDMSQALITAGINAINSQRATVSYLPYVKLAVGIAVTGMVAHGLWSLKEQWDWLKQAQEENPLRLRHYTDLEGAMKIEKNLGVMEARYTNDGIYFSPDAFPDSYTTTMELGLSKVAEVFMELFMFKEADALVGPKPAKAGKLPDGTLTPGGSAEYVTQNTIYTHSPLRVRTAWIPISRGF